MVAVRAQAAAEVQLGREDCALEMAFGQAGLHRSRLKAGAAARMKFDGVAVLAMPRMLLESS